MTIIDDFTWCVVWQHNWTIFNILLTSGRSHANDYWFLFTILIDENVQLWNEHCQLSKTNISLSQHVGGLFLQASHPKISTASMFECSLINGMTSERRWWFFHYEDINHLPYALTRSFSQRSHVVITPYLHSTFPFLQKWYNIKDK